jgi:DNA-binding NtrC family response regulator
MPFKGIKKLFNALKKDQKAIQCIGMHASSSIDHSASSIQHRAFSIQHPAFSIEHLASSIQHPASSSSIKL